MTSFTVKVEITELKKAARAATHRAKITVDSNGYKGTVDMTYECVNTGSGSDPTLSHYTESLYIDEGTDGVDFVDIFAEDANFLFTACGVESGGSESDCDSASPS